MAEVLPALMIVLGAIVLVRFGLQGLGLAPRAGARKLRVVESCALTTRQRLCLVEVEGERLLVGAGDAGVTLLRRLPTGDATGDPAEAPSPEPDARTATSTRSRGWGRWVAAVTGVSAMLIAWPAGAETDVGALSLALEGATGPDEISSTLEIVALMTLVSVAPSILLMATCFTRILVVLALLRQAIGIQQLPPSQVLVGLAFFTTLFVMAPVGEQIRVDAYEPYVAREIDAETATERALQPVRRFLLAHTRERDLALFMELSGHAPVADLAEIPSTHLLPAYVISELRTAFEIGFMVYLPFLVVDLVVASMLISMGMIVLPPIVISLPFKLMLFVLLDGWNLVLGSLVKGLV